MKISPLVHCTLYTDHTDTTDGLRPAMTIPCAASLVTSNKNSKLSDYSFALLITCLLACWSSLQVKFSSLGTVMYCFQQQMLLPGTTGERMKIWDGQKLCFAKSISLIFWWDFQKKFKNCQRYSTKPYQFFLVFENLVKFKRVFGRCSKLENLLRFHNKSQILKTEDWQCSPCFTGISEVAWIFIVLIPIFGFHLCLPPLPAIAAAQQGFGTQILLKWVCSLVFHS